MLGGGAGVGKVIGEYGVTRRKATSSGYGEAAASPTATQAASPGWTASCWPAVGTRCINATEAPAGCDRSALVPLCLSCRVMDI